ncbi:hypothetical protein EDD85DRAFT_787971 [Armillaria nabsnona]|nr:hypothetical protein EDD85DRAFT_787971 [Armillaria nabsnona]
MNAYRWRNLPFDRRRNQAKTPKVKVQSVAYHWHSMATSLPGEKIMRIGQKNKLELGELNEDSSYNTYQHRMMRFEIKRLTMVVVEVKVASSMPDHEGEGERRKDCVWLMSERLREGRRWGMWGGDRRFLFRIYVTANSINEAFSKDLAKLIPSFSGFLERFIHDFHEILDATVTTAVTVARYLITQTSYKTYKHENFLPSDVNIPVQYTPVLLPILNPEEIEGHHAIYLLHFFVSWKSRLTILPPYRRHHSAGEQSNKGEKVELISDGTTEPSEPELSLLEGRNVFGNQLTKVPIQSPSELESLMPRRDCRVDVYRCYRVPDKETREDDVEAELRFSPFHQIQACRSRRVVVELGSLEGARIQQLKGEQLIARFEFVRIFHCGIFDEAERRWGKTPVELAFSVVTDLIMHRALFSSGSGIELLNTLNSRYSKPRHSSGKVPKASDRQDLFQKSSDSSTLGMCDIHGINVRTIKRI